MMKAIGLTGHPDDGEHQAVVAAQLLDRFTARQIKVSVCLGIATIEQAHAIYSGGGELWRVGQDVSQPHLDAHIDRQIDTSCHPAKLIENVDHAIGLFLGKKRVA